MKFLLLLFTLSLADIAFGQSQNYLINGGFDLWQRGNVNAKLTSPIDNSGYLADRWFITDLTSTSYDRTATNLPTGQTYGAQMTLTGTSAYLCQRLEADNTKHLSGLKMTISGYEYSSLGSGPLKIKIDRPNTVDDYSGKGKYGTTVTSEVSPTTLIATTGTTLNFFRHTFSVSANMANYGFQICLGTNASTTTTYKLSAVMLNEGIKAYKFRKYGTFVGEDFISAQRYYEKSITGAAGDDNNAQNTYNMGTDTAPQAFVQKYSTPKRVVPMIATIAAGGSIQQNTTSGNGCYTAMSYGDICNASIFNHTVNGFNYNITSNSSYGVGRYFQWFANAEL